MSYKYTVIHKKNTGDNDYPAMSPPKYQYIDLGKITTETPVQLKERINDQLVIDINHTFDKTILTVI